MQCLARRVLTPLTTTIHSAIAWLRSRCSLRLRRLSFVGSLVLLLFTTFVPLATAHAATTLTSDTTPYAGTPNTYQPQAPSTTTPPPLPGAPAPVISGPANPSHGIISHGFTPSMQPLALSLSSVVSTGAPAVPQAAHATSSDGRLEITVPQTALTSADIASAAGSTGGVQLAIDEIAPPSGSTDGGSGNGLITLGTYLFQVQDLKGHEVGNGIGLRQAITVTFHLPSHLPVPASSFVWLTNPALPSHLPHAAQHFGKPQTVATTYNATTHTLTTQMPLAASSGGGGLSAAAPVGYFGKPDAFQTDLHTGSLTNSYAIAVPRGPGGLTPNLNLSYNSEAAAETHGPQATGPWVGIGWNLDPGEITWNESRDSTLANGNDLGWRSAWSISDPYGTSGPLIPSGTTVDTFYDDTVNPPATTPQVWHTAPESHTKIISYTNPVTNPYFPPWDGTTGYKVQPPCFRVWLPSGILEEFGCTQDSLQWYISPTDQSTNYVNAWKLDLITDPNGNQIHYTYAQDKPTYKGNIYVRDIALSSVTWDAPNCHNANVMCTGSAWNLKFQVVFDATKTAAPGATVCSGTGGLRCDDPIAETPPAIGTPEETNTYILNNIIVEANPSGTWSTLRNYQLAYGQTHGSNPGIDPFSGNTISHAGHLLLEQITETGTDGTAYPASTFGYTYEQEYYEDSNYQPSPTNNCGPVWNNGAGYNGACRLWQQTWNAYFLSTADNGQGLHQTFSWIHMRTNQHGVTSGNNALDPNYCTREQTNRGASETYPCDVADDNGWSHFNLAERDVSVIVPLSTGNQTQTRWYVYYYDLASLSAQECGDCKVGMYWGDANEGDSNDFYNGKFTGFPFAEEEIYDGANTIVSLENDNTYTTEGWGVWSPSTIHCRDGQSTCPNAAYMHTTNAASGHTYQIDSFNAPVNGNWPLEKRQLTTWTVTCPPSGVSGSNPGNGSGQLIAELDQENPVVVCDVQDTQDQTYYADGNGSPSSSNVPYLSTTTSYNANGQVTQTTTSGNDLGTNAPIVKKDDYLTNNNISTTNTSATGTYILDAQAFSDVEDSSGNRKACSFTSFDGQPYATGSSTNLTRGLPTQVDKYADCVGQTGKVTTKTVYNTNGDTQATLDADANAGITSHQGCTLNGNTYTTCTGYDATYGTLTASITNVLNQATTTNYTTTSAFGFGLWPSSVTDLNGQSTSTTYDPLGRVLSTTSPGETSGLTTTTLSYQDTCATTGAQAPCLEVDTTKRLDANTTVVTQSFYDGYGNLVETRAPAPGGNDIIQYSEYDALGRQVFKSEAYYIPSSTPAGFVTPDTTKPGTSTTYDGMGRVLTSIDANSAKTTTSYAAVCAPAGTGDSGCYSQITTVDANGHQHLSLADALGHDRYDQDFTGTSSSGYTLYRTSKQGYDYLGDVTTITYADGTHNQTKSYNGLGELTGYTDPDLGTYTLGYDANGNETVSTAPNGSYSTCYDGLDRVTQKSFTSDCSNPFAAYTYDQGTNGIGRLSSETFASGPSQSVTGGYTYTYDVRGRQTGWTLTIGGASYPFTFAFNDAGQQTSMTYPDGDVLATSYGAQDWLSGVTETPQGGSSNTLLNSVLYAGNAGAAGKATGASVGNSAYTWSLGYDLDLRLSETKAVQVSNSATMFDQLRQFDAMGDVVGTNTTLPAGTDNQAFCYDEQDRLVWAGSTGTPTCSTLLTAGTLTGQGAQYTQPCQQRSANNPRVTIGK